MARSLNKSRIRNSKIAVIAAFLIVFFTKAFVEYETPLHEAVEYIGYLLVAFCALGRLYATAFLGGHKNATLITYGAFSMTRNPLYFCSLVGMTGIAMISGHILIIVGIPVFFLVLYHQLIKREEEFLLETFGADYAAYMASTPRLWPNVGKYNAPERIETVPTYLNKAFKDAIWWFVPFPLFEVIEMLHESGIITPIAMMP
jgi:protein-S-isoprenylcysteine O-methyltransferase Ste14